MTYQVRVAPRAAEQIREASEWWSENRLDAPHAFVDDLGRALDLVRSIPDIGQPVSHPEHEGIRRLFLRRLRYHLYYVVAVETSTVDVLAIWHSSRGSQPDL